MHRPSVKKGNILNKKLVNFKEPQFAVKEDNELTRIEISFLSLSSLNKIPWLVFNLPPLDIKQHK